MILCRMGSVSYTHLIRFLLNYRMDSENPLALILAGQTELWEKLKLHAYLSLIHI